MNALIASERLPEWVPGEILLASDGLGWRQIGLRSFRYPGQDVIVPAMRDYMLVSYQAGDTPMQRRFEGRWRRDTLGPGAVSLLTRAQLAHWHWKEPIDVTHLYFSPGLLAEVASEMLDCHVAEVRLNDVLRAEDPAVTAVVRAIAEEARQQGLGGALYVESMARALSVHLLRRYASIERRGVQPKGGLTPAQMRRIEDFVEAHLGEALELGAMAAALGLKPCLFAKLFRQSFGRPPYAHVIARRIDRARRLLAVTDLPIKEIAALCGFTDQAHMTRLFAREGGVTPAVWRKKAAA